MAGVLGDALARPLACRSLRERRQAGWILATLLLSLAALARCVEHKTPSSAYDDLGEKAKAWATAVVNGRKPTSTWIEENNSVWTTFIALYPNGDVRQAIVDQGEEIGVNARKNWSTVLDCNSTRQVLIPATWYRDPDGLVKFNGPFDFISENRTQLVVRELMRSTDRVASNYTCIIQNTNGDIELERKIWLKLFLFEVMVTVNVPLVNRTNTSVMIFWKITVPVAGRYTLELSRQTPLYPLGKRHIEITGETASGDWLVEHLEPLTKYSAQFLVSNSDGIEEAKRRFSFETVEPPRVMCNASELHRPVGTDVYIKCEIKGSQRITTTVLHDQPSHRGVEAIFTNDAATLVYIAVKGTTISRIISRNSLGEVTWQIKIIADTKEPSRNVCQPLTQPNHGYMEQPNLSNGTVVIFTCPPDHVLVGSAERQCIDGKWTGTTAGCSRKTPPSAKIWHHEIRDGLFRVLINTPFQLHCSALGFPLPRKVHWFVDNHVRVKEYNNVMGQQVLRPMMFNRSMSFGSLWSKHGLTKDVNISCEAKRNGTRGDDGVQIHIVGNGTYQPEHVQVLSFGEGFRVSVACRPPFGHTKRVNWSAPLSLKLNSSHLLFKSMQLSHAGYYSCVDEEGLVVDMVHIKVEEFVVSFTINNNTVSDSVQVDYGSLVELQCNTEGTQQSPLGYMLHQSRTEMEAPELINVQRSVIDSNTWRISPFKRINDGIYLCNASNGGTWKTTQVKVEGRPRSCFAYTGRVCASCFVGGSSQRVAPDPSHFAVVSKVDQEIENLLQNVSSVCAAVARTLICNQVFPPCFKSAGATWKRSVCQQDCLLAQHGYCSENDWRTIEKSALFNGNEHSNTLDCKRLPSPQAGQNIECVRVFYEGHSDMSISEENDQLAGGHCYCGRGGYYNGNKSMSHAGECQGWLEPQPHVRPDLSAEFHPSITSNTTYCRNPGNRGDRPWCYTANKKVRWSYCNIQRCDHDISSTCVNYTTLDNQQCSSVPLVANNLVRVLGERSFDIDSELRQVTDLSISKVCNRHLHNLVCLAKFSPCSRQNPNSCGRTHSVCSDYCTTVRNVCQQWLRPQGPNYWTKLSPEISTIIDCMYPDLKKADSEAGTYFVKKDSEAGTYPECISLPVGDLQNEANGHSEHELCLWRDGTSYRGYQNTTSSGHHCQPWRAWWPHRPAPHFKETLFPELIENYCRNPGGQGERPWCYTMDGSVRWEYCNVARCPQDGDSATTVLLLLPSVGVLLVIFIFLLVVSIFRRRNRKDGTLRSIEQMRKAGELHPNVDMLKRRGSLSDSHEGRVAVLHSLSRNFVMRENPEYWLSSPALYNITKIDHDDVDITAQIAEGYFGTVWKGMVNGVGEGGESTLVAIKTLKNNCNQQTEQGFLKEAQVISRFRHINIIRLLGVCVPDKAAADRTPEFQGRRPSQASTISPLHRRPLCLIFEYMEFGDLLHFLREAGRHRQPTVDFVGRPLTAEAAQRLNTQHLEVQARHPSQASTSSSPLQLSLKDLCQMAAQVANGMQFLSQRCYVHRDLAARNCLVGKRLIVKIADFGMSRDIHNKDYYKPDSNWTHLPVRWMPPEVLMYGKHTTESDVWSFGVVLWEIFTLGLHPYYDLSNEEVVRRVCQNNHRLPQPPGCPLSIFELMTECWDGNPEERPVFRRLRNVLRSWQPPEDIEDDSSSMDSDMVRSPSISDDENVHSDSVFEASSADNHLFVTSPHGKRVPRQSATEIGLSGSGMSLDASDLGRMDSGNADDSISSSSDSRKVTSATEHFSDLDSPPSRSSPQQSQRQFSDLDNLSSSSPQQPQLSGRNSSWFSNSSDQSTALDGIESHRQQESTAPKLQDLNKEERT